MEETCVYIGIYFGLSYGACDERICPIRAIPYAGMADVDAICSVWDTDCENKWKSAEMVPHCLGNRDGCVLGLELV